MKIGYGFNSLGDRIHRLPTSSPPALAVNILGHVDIRVTYVVPPNLRPCALAQHTAGMHGAKAPKMPLSPEVEESESLQMLFANIRGQIGFRACRCDLCNRSSHALVCRGCQKRVDVARMRPAAYDCHARDLSALVDLVSHGCEEVGTGRKQRVKIGHHAVLVDEGMGPVEVGVPVASHHLAPVVDAAGFAAKISRR
jgi:hypothetical protein